MEHIVLKWCCHTCSCLCLILRLGTSPRAPSPACVCTLAPVATNQHETTPYIITGALACACRATGSSSAGRPGASFIPMRISSSSRMRFASFFVLNPFHNFWKNMAAWSASISARAVAPALCDKHQQHTTHGHRGRRAFAALFASCLLISVMNMARCRPCRPLSFLCRILHFALGVRVASDSCTIVSPHAFVNWHFLLFCFFALRLFVDRDLVMEGVPHLVALRHHAGVHAVPMRKNAY